MVGLRQAKLSSCRKLVLDRLVIWFCTDSVAALLAELLAMLLFPSTFCAGTIKSVRNLHAPSEWQRTSLRIPRSYYYHNLMRELISL